MKYLRDGFEFVFVASWTMVVLILAAVTIPLWLIAKCADWLNGITGDAVRAGQVGK